MKKVLMIFFVLVVVGTTYGVASMATMPQVQLPLAPVAVTPPYDDEDFFNMANGTIEEICNGKILPAGKMNDAVYDSLASTYYSLIRMNISEENYPQAEKIVSFLSYTLTFLEKYDDYETEKAKRIPVDMGLITDNELESWYNAAEEAFLSLSDRYPNAKMYGMPPLLERIDWIPGQFPVI